MTPNELIEKAAVPYRSRIVDGEGTRTPLADHE
jgi:hypothetical protein